MHERFDQSNSGVSDRGLVPCGLLIVVGGIGGLDWCGIAVRHVVKVARMPYSIQLFPWGHGFLRWHADLTSITNRDVRAKVLAQTISQFKTDHPRSPVVIVAKSGGSGVGVKALELLNEGTVEARRFACSGTVASVRPHCGAPRSPPRHGRFLVAAGPDRTGAGYAIVRHN